MSSNRFEPSGEIDLDNSLYDKGMDWSFDKPDVPYCVVYIFNKDDVLLREMYEEHLRYNQKRREMLVKVNAPKHKLERIKHLTYEEWYDEYVEDKSVESDQSNK